MDENERVEALRRLKEEMARANDLAEAVSVEAAWRMLTELISGEIAQRRQN